MELGVWGFCAGDETIPPKLTAPILASNASQMEIVTLNREYKDDVRCDAVVRFQPLEIPVQTNTDGLS